MSATCLWHSSSLGVTTAVSGDFGRQPHNSGVTACQSALAFESSGERGALSCQAEATPSPIGKQEIGRVTPRVHPPFQTDHTVGDGAVFNIAGQYYFNPNGHFLIELCRFLERHPKSEPSFSIEI